MALLELMWILFELFAEVLMLLTPGKSKLERNIDRLKKEEWFSKMYGNEFKKYLDETPEMQKYLKKRRNIQRLKCDPYEQTYFTR
ncbi:hypothetical protein [Pseudalkalibacillus decolorationis]|uniref:hypothetical protein n=1 Tax=Pseudalkalibacillus decolorationis TaxID=163879 RepID=UPI002148A2DA|nr:hypothetical protein [Pseudalkalibacillus decolorationis]